MGTCPHPTMSEDQGMAVLNSGFLPGPYVAVILLADGSWAVVDAQTEVQAINLAKAGVGGLGYGTTRAAVYQVKDGWPATRVYSC